MPTLKLPGPRAARAPTRCRRKLIAGVARRGPRGNRVAFAAAHVVADPLAAVDPWLAAAIDWEATLAFRRYLWGQGLGVAEAMDTAQRGMGLDWPTSLELIRRRSPNRAASRARWSSPAPVPTTSRRIRTRSIDEVIAAYERAVRGDRTRWWPHDPDGQPRAGRLRAVAGRLRAGVLDGCCRRSPSR